MALRDTLPPPSYSPELLKTKLARPVLPVGRVSRAHLVERIEAAAERRLTVLAAPAGSGKTSLLAEWAESRAQRGMPLAWLSLEQRDDEVGRFLCYVIAAVRTACSDIGEDALNMLRVPGQTVAEPVILRLMNELAESGAEVTLVLDDFHSIDSPPVLEAMALLVDAAPPNLHLIVASRVDPPLPLAKLRARGELAELRSAELRFDERETKALLNDVAGLHLADAQIKQVTERTEGWAAGLRLVTLSIDRQTEPDDVIAKIGATNRHVLDYLADEVLDQQPPDVRRFLLVTSILERLTAPVCDALTDRSDSQLLLERLERANLFIEPLDVERRWYRYHHLFSEFLEARLRRELSSEEVSELHRRAARWHERDGAPDLAIRHALAARDFDDAARILESAGPVQIGIVSHNERIKRELELLPDEVVRSRPKLCLFHAWARLVALEHAGVEERLRDAERAVARGQGDRSVLGGIASLRGARARYGGRWDRSVAHLGRALELLPEDDAAARGMALMHLAAGHLARGDLVAVDQALADVRALGHRLGLPGFVRLFSEVIRGRMQLVRGELDAAAQAFDSAASEALRYGGPASPIGAGAELGLAAVALDRGDLELAGQHVRAGLRRARHWIDPLELSGGHLLSARILHAGGREADALEALGDAESVAERAWMPWVVSQVKAYSARFALQAGNLPAATQWADAYQPALFDESGGLRDVEQLTLARYLMARGAFDEAAGILTELSAHAAGVGHGLRALEALVVEALLKDAAGDVEAALSRLEDALEQAAAERRVRVIADEGPRMAALLAQLLKKSRRKRALGRVPDAFIARVREQLEDPSHVPRPGQSESLLEPLSTREVEVLALLAQGASNDEIGRRLHVAVSTVKRHVYNIFGKLGVKNRTQATARARELRLIS